jgi:sirohydrochlorin cobaltochelatase
MKNISKRPVIIIVNFSSGAPEVVKDLERIDEMVMARYPDNEVRWVFAYGGSRKKLLASGGTTFARKVPVKSLEEVYADLRKEGKRDVVVQNLLITTGDSEYSTLMTPADDLNVEYAYPLLQTPDNIGRVARALEPDFGTEDTVTIICGHGSEKMPAFNLPLLRLDKYLRTHYHNVFLATLDGPPGNEAAFADALKSGLKKVKFIPFIIVPGEHLSHDIIGDNPESYKSQLRLEVASTPGLYASPAVMSIWMEGIDWALVKFSSLG